MQAFEVPEVDYTRYTNRQLAAVPLAVLAVALGVLAVTFLSTGAPVALGIEFTGGAELRVVTDTPRAEIPDAFGAEVAAVQAVEATNQPTYIVTFRPESGAGADSLDVGTLAEQARGGLTAVGGSDVVQSQQSTSPVFGESAQQSALTGVAVAFVGMSVLAFLLFRTFVPSVAIVISAFSDIVIPVALMNALGIRLSLGTVAALLMLIGYSVDSDILLNNHVLRRSGGFYESTYRAMRTGVTMTLTSIAAMAVMATVAFLYGIELFTSIGLVLVLGLAADLMNTYLLNLSLLRWYMFEGIAR